MVDEIVSVQTKLKTSGKSIDNDGIHPQMLKYCGQQFLILLYKLFNAAFANNKWPWDEGKVIFLRKPAQLLSSSSARSYDQDKRSLLNEESIRKAAKVQGLPELSRRQLESVSKSLKEPQNVKPNPHVKLPEPKDIEHEKEKQIRAAARGYELQSDPRLAQHRHEKIKPVKPDTDLMSSGNAIKSVLESMAAENRPTKSEKPDSHKVPAFPSHEDDTAAHPKRRTRPGHRKGHPYIADGKPKELVDVEVDHVDITHNFNAGDGSVKLNAHGSNFVFNLQKNKIILDDIELVLRGAENLDAIEEGLKDMNIYSDNKTGSSFLVRQNNAGTKVVGARFRRGAHDYHMELSREFEGKHVVKRSVINRMESGTNLDRVLRSVEASQSSRKKRELRADDSVIAHIEVRAMLDLSIWEYHYTAGDGSEESGVENAILYFAHVFNLMNLRYANIQNPQLVITVSLVSIDMAMSVSGNAAFENNMVSSGEGIYGEDLLDELTTVVMNDQLDSDGNYTFDHLMAFTYLDLYSNDGSSSLLGIAWLSGVCDHVGGYASSVVEATPYDLEQIVNIAAHELGHNLGSEHDNSDECEPDAGWIMGASVTYPNNLFFYFSCCSQRQFWTTLADGRACIDLSVTSEDYYAVSEKAGEIYDTDHLCQVAFETNAADISYYINNNLNLCEGLWCVDPDDSSLHIHSYFIPPQGTECGTGKWCIETQCVDVSENETTIYQGPHTCDLSNLPMRADCAYDELQCETGVTIYGYDCYYVEQYCDGNTDCEDASDEKYCRCEDGMFPCGTDSNGFPLCYDAQMFCNGVENCNNGTDEEGCDLDCPSGYLKCDEGSATSLHVAGQHNCYPEAGSCDYSFDCYDLSDEKDCACDTGNYCEASDFGRNVSFCLRDEITCDQNVHCNVNYEDEINCECDPGQVKCPRNYNCIPENWICDGYDDCPDRLDEFNCTICWDGTTGIPVQLCRVLGWSCLHIFCRMELCSDGSYCIYSDWYCDREADCDDGSDEESCGCQSYGMLDCELQGTTNITSSYNYDYYGNECLSGNRVCDNITDCVGAEDENKCDRPCPANYSSCISGATHLRYWNDTTNLQMSPACYPDELRCNEWTDCYDGSDEYNCTCEDYGEITCNSSGMCIPVNYICDEYDDCYDGEDEYDCPCWQFDFECSTYNSSDNKCLSLFSVCDGIRDCIDGSDEGDICICGAEQFTCNNGSVLFPPHGACTANDTVCDSKINCFDESDEIDCDFEDVCPPTSVLRCLAWADSLYSNETTTYYDYYEVPIYICLENSSICDGSYDCIDGEDESNCPCQNEYDFQCSDGTCYPWQYECDSDSDCTYGEDEYNCTCMYDEFKCGDSSQCIPKSWVCDSYDDCFLGEDEDIELCFPVCSEDEFRCESASYYSDSLCIPKSWQCDEYADCSCHSDEDPQICNGTCPPGSVWCQLDSYNLATYEYSYYSCINVSCDGNPQCRNHEDQLNCNNCDSSDFVCDDGECISSSWECDSIIDCSNAEDEWYCGSQHCDDYQMVCPGSDNCIYLHWFCDNIPDCDQGTDESFCNDICIEDQFRCEVSVNRYNSSTPCIPDDWKCDGYADCWDGSDEAYCDYMCQAESGDDDSTYCRSMQSQNEYMCVHSYSSFVCDGTIDCMGYEDEYNFDCDLEFCESNEFMCPDGECIASNRVCNGYYDCEERNGIFFDEYFCDNTHCSEDEFDCNGTCVNADQICDGNHDCTDGRDEYRCDEDCPAELDRCEAGATTETFINLQSNNWQLMDIPPHCYNNSALGVSLDCFLSKCIDFSDIEGCTCQDYAESLEKINVTFYFGDDAILCPVTILGTNLITCFDRNDHIFCNNYTDCSNGIDELVCEETTTVLINDATTPWTWNKPTAWDSDRLYPFGDEAGDWDVMMNMDDWETYWMCDKVDLNGRVGAQYYDNRYYKIYVCNNGMLTFNLEWRLHYPSVFETDYFYDNIDILAPFWGLIDEATMALLGTVASEARTRAFYHAYQRGVDIDSDSEAVLDRATKDVANSEYAMEGFTATWVLVATWVNQKADEGCSWDSFAYFLDWNDDYPTWCKDQALSNKHLNHFQAVVITDGIYTFVKFNYPEDGINWLLPSLHEDLSEEEFKEVVDNSYHTSGLPIAAIKNSVDSHYLLSPLARLGLDELPGNMADKRPGEYLFRLEDSSGEANAEFECFDWMYEELESIDMYTNYSLNMAPCPPTLFNMWFDWSFHWIGYESDQTICFQSNFDEEGYAGLRQMCCYNDDWFSDSESALIVGPPYGGYPININNMDHEIHGRQACCVEAFEMCNLFHEVRVSSNGETYPFPVIWPWFGDPHITTSDGLTYTFNGLGEYLFTNIDNGKTIIQARTERVVLADGDLGQATYFSAVCISNDGLPRLQIQINKNNDISGVENELQLIIDDDMKDIALISQDLNISQSMDGVDTKIQFKRTNSSLTVLFSSGVSITTAAANKMLTITLGMPAKFVGKTFGLTGLYDNNKENDLTSFDGSSISINSTESEIFDWASEFAVSEGDSIMYYTDNTDWSTYNDNSFVPVFVDDIDNWVWSTEEFKTAAYDLCETDTSCLYDVYITGDLSVGESSKQTAEDSQATNAVLSNFPPTIRGNDKVLIVIGEPFEYVVTVNDSNGDVISVTTNIPSTIVVDGDVVTITVTVTNTTGFVFRVTAKDPAGAASTKSPMAMLCNCMNDGTCIHLSEEEQSIIESPSVVLGCTCPTGYTGSLCDTDLDACALVASACYPSVPCIDLPAPADHTGYTCGNCPVGYTGDGKTCSDIDECTEDVCGHICINSPGSFVCSCRTGYSLNIDGSTCDDIDECALDPCHQSCLNTDGSFTCTCDSGFALTDDTINCEPENPCEDPNPCDATNGYCNTVGDNKECSCKKGYTLNADGSTCDEIDECLLGTHHCAQVCNNTVGGYTCSCESGYSLASNGLDCDDVNECVTGNYECHTTQMCSNNPGGYDCVCATGQVFKNGRCQNQVFTDPVEAVTTLPDQAAELNSVRFALQGMAVSEYTLMKEISLFTLLADSATAACARTSCDYVPVVSETKRRRKRSANSVTFYKEYFSRLPGYPIDNNGDLELAIYTLIPGSGVLPSEALKLVVEDVSTNISVTLGANLINLEALYTEAPPTTDNTEVTAEPFPLTTVYIAVGVGLGVLVLAIIIAIVIVKLKKGNENTKTVYPISDPEFSRKASRTESVVSGVPKKEPEFCVELQYETVAIASQPPPTVVHAQSVESDQPSRPVSGKHVQDHSSRVQTPTKNSFAPVDTEGAPKGIQKELTCKSLVVSDFYTSKQPSFDIPYLALLQGDKQNNQKTRICLIPPTPQPNQHDPYANYHLT
ncbi:uncharacterized protein [Watersipora subatra]|uniref:uncharacterized protein n=1 Tax=Watersipora subatra TaxID=2589382 RepID=UPI00355B1977